MKTAFATLLVTVAFATADEALKDLLKEFHVKVPRALERPFVGDLHPFFPVPVDGKGEPQPLELNVLYPPVQGGPLAVYTPHLATESGEGFMNLFALRPTLPPEKEIAEVETYANLVKLLGEPTQPALSGQVGDGWAFDGVLWRLFKPLTDHSIKVLQIIVNRKYQYQRNAKVEQIFIESLTIRSGILTEKGRRVLVCDSESSLRRYEWMRNAILECPSIENASVEEAFVQLYSAAKTQNRPFFGMTFQGDIDTEGKGNITLRTGEWKVLELLEKFASQGNFFVYLREDGSVQARRDLDTRAAELEVPDPFGKP
ncbi:hypothetical protein WJU23_10180 [Prosthecobacter sp. SYSU 5D2]|uniref:hypothetical protein n=1 Tax=Prosthecobacter sp. SYSU 5D2 TaxID=3134134 RepID=UPI0031FED7C8